MKLIFNSFIKYFFPPFILLFLLIVLLETAIGLHPDYAFLFGKPSEIARIFPEYLSRYNTWDDILYTSSSCLLGIMIGTSMGIIFGTIISISKAIEIIVSPVITALASIPLVALAPIFVFWFGIDWSSKVAVASFASFFIAAHSSFVGGKEACSMVDKNIFCFAKNRWQVTINIALPGSLKYVFQGLQLNIGTGLVAVIIGEFISSQKGLGHALLQASSLYKMNEVWCVLIVLMSISLIFQWVVKTIGTKMINDY